MWLVTSAKWKQFKEFARSLSFRLTMMYAGIMLLILLFTTVLAIGSVHYLLMRQLQFDVRVSAQHTMLYLEQNGRIDDRIFRGQNILPFVELVVYDHNGFPVLDNIPRFEKLKPLNIAGLGVDFDKDEVHFDSVETEDDLIYHYIQRWRSPQGHIYYLEFSREGSREKYFIRLLVQQIITTILAGLGIAVLAGIFLTNKVLEPLRAMKEPLRHIEVDEMGYRVPVPAVKDEQRELALVINRALDRIEHGVTQQKQFVSDASHELRTPITVISGYTDLLIRWGATDTETLQEGLEAIRAETDYMRQLIEHLLFIARASAGELKVDLKPLNTADAVREVWNATVLIDKGRHVMNLAANEEACILADESMFRQLLRIFLENALKYTPDGKEVTLTAKVQDKELAVFIADKGIGIPEKDLPHIFTRFYRVDSSRTKDTGGTGLGLAIAQDIVNLHQGARLAVESKLGEGTVFELFFPIVAMDGDEPEEEWPAAKPPAEGDEAPQVSDSGTGADAADK